MTHHNVGRYIVQPSTFSFLEDRGPVSFTVALEFEFSQLKPRSINTCVIFPNVVVGRTGLGELGMDPIAE